MFAPIWLTFIMWNNNCCHEKASVLVWIVAHIVKVLTKRHFYLHCTISGMDEYESLRLSILRIFADFSGKLMDLEMRVSRMEATNKRLPAGFSKLQIVELLERHFDVNEIDMLAWDLGLNADNIRGESRDERTRALMSYCERHNLVAALLERCQDLRPEITWPRPSTRPPTLP